MPQKPGARMPGMTEYPCSRVSSSIFCTVVECHVRIPLGDGGGIDLEHRVRFVLWHGGQDCQTARAQSQRVSITDTQRCLRVREVAAFTRQADGLQAMPHRKEHKVPGLEGHRTQGRRRDALKRVVGFGRQAHGERFRTQFVAPGCGVLRHELLIQQRTREPDGGGLAQFQLARDLAHTKAAAHLVAREQFEDAQAAAQSLRAWRLAVVSRSFQSWVNPAQVVQLMDRLLRLYLS